MRIAAPLVLITLSGIPESMSAQELEPSDLSPDDSIAIFTAVIQRTLTELGPESAEYDRRIWIPAALVERTAPGPDGQYPRVSESIRRGLGESFPGVRFVEDYARVFDLVFECPEGVEVRMPGRGCPVQDGGVVVMLGAISPGEAGRLWTHCSLAQSAPSSRRPGVTNSWAQGFRLDLVRSEDGGWEVVNTTVPWIT